MAAQKLSIVIPTYNRNEVLLKVVRRITEQTNKNFELIIIDNNSPENPKKELEGMLLKSKILYKFLRNKSNIGGDANIIKAFEVASGDWLWILGDDDLPYKESVDIIYSNIEDKKDYLFINFLSQNEIRKQSFSSIGIEDFIKRLDYMGGLNFNSTGLWNLKYATPMIGFAYRYSYSMSTTFSILLNGLNSSGKCFFSNEKIIEKVSIVDKESKWQFLKFIKSFNLILEIPNKEYLRRILLKKMSPWTTPEYISAYLLLGSKKNAPSSHEFKIIKYRLWPYLNLFEKLRFQLCTLFFLTPFFSKKLVLYLIKSANFLGFKNIDIDDLIKR